MMSEIGKWLLLGGVILFVLGGAFWLAGKIGLPLGELPGDIHAKGERWSIHFPIATCIVISIVLTVLLNLVARLIK